VPSCWQQHTLSKASRQMRTMPFAHLIMLVVVLAQAPATMAKGPIKGHNPASLRPAGDSRPPLPGKGKAGKRKAADPDD
jgi:hypothetical protein